MGLEAVVDGQDARFIEVVRSDPEFKRLLGFFTESRPYEVDDAQTTRISVDDRPTEFVVSVPLISDERTERAEINATVRDGDVVSVVATVDHYESGTIVNAVGYGIVDGEVSQLVEKSSGGSGAASGNQCLLCRILYRHAKSAIQNGLRSSTTLNSGYLCKIARQQILRQIGSHVLGNPCKNMATQVINYIQNNGHSADRNAACQSIGACP